MLRETMQNYYNFIDPDFKMILKLNLKLQAADWQGLTGLRPHPSLVDGCVPSPWGSTFLGDVFVESQEAVGDI